MLHGAVFSKRAPLVVPNGIIVFDEYAVHQWGESKAVDEFFKDKNVVLKSLPWTFSPTAYLKKEKS
jgi:peroxiredoxin